jgi:3-phenylpropionate/trans-cinnamate dioxygenase ferredoxin subunit
VSALPAARLSELEVTKPVRVVLDGVPVALVRLDDDSVHAVGDTCTHADVSLAEGDVDGCTIECWLHGSTFDLRTGRHHRRRRRARRRHHLRR